VPLRAESSFGATLYAILPDYFCGEFNLEAQHRAEDFGRVLRL
jgi:hypothetical protein